jgi:hypothetical protein
LKKVWKEIQFKRFEGRKWKNHRRQREHDRKENAKRAPMVPNRRSPK